MQRSNSSLSLYIDDDRNIIIQTQPKVKIHRCSSCNNLVDDDDDVVYVLRSDGLQMRREGNSNPNGLNKKLIQQEKMMHALNKQLERDRRSTADLNKKLDRLSYRSMSNLPILRNNHVQRKQKNNWRRGILRYFGKS